ncbi:MAG: hypothetical protein IPG96_15380 [Proteobacteria bacterium]|nr:hypothetical protein [Pseudomonadota bacterium]
MSRSFTSTSDRLAWSRARLLALIVLVGGWGCGSAVETSVVIERTTSTACKATVDGQARPMNAWVVEVYPALASGSGGEPSCLGINQRLCALAVRRCSCRDALPPSPEGLRAALSGTRLPDLDSGHYCVRVLALELTGQPVGPLSDSDRICDCKDADLNLLATVLAGAEGAWQLSRMPLPGGPGLPALPRTWDQTRSILRGCAMSPTPAVLNEGGQHRLDLHCLDDVPADASASPPVGANKAALWRCLGS